MKRLIIVSSLIFLSGLSHQAWAEKRGEDLSEEDIKKSVARILKAFRNQPTQPITEGKVNVGEISTEENEFYITYRPSLGMEVLACIDKSLYPFSNTSLKIEGHGHKGLTKLFSSKDVDTTIIGPFMKQMKKTQIPSEEMTIIIDGMSMGTHRAMEAAIYLKQHDDTKTYTPIVLRYGDSKTFDEIAAHSIYNFLPKENIISFHAREDVRFSNLFALKF